MLYNILPNIRTLGIHAATQKTATKMNCSVSSSFSIHEILMSQTPFVSEQGSNVQQLPFLRVTRFTKPTNPSKLTRTLLRLPLTPSKQTQKSSVLRAETRRVRKRAPANGVLFSRKGALHCLHGVAFTDEDTCFSSAI